MGFGDGFYKQVPDNIVLDNSSPLFDNIVDDTVNLYVSTTGDDTYGDGSESNPYATPQRAVDAIPKDVLYPTQVKIYCGAGNFEFPEVRNAPGQINITFIGDISEPIISIPAGSASFSRVSGKQARWTANVGSYTQTITDGSHWRYGVSTFNPNFSLAWPILASSSPNLEIVQGFDNTSWYDQTVHEYKTFFYINGVAYRRGPSDGSNALRESSNIQFNGISISKKPDAGYAYLLGRFLAFYGSRFEQDVQVDLENCNFYAFMNGNYITLNGCNTYDSHFKAQTQINNYGPSTNLFSGCIVGPMNSNQSATILCYDIDFEGTGTVLGAYDGSSNISIARCTVANTFTTFVVLDSPNSSVDIGNFITGSCTGNAIIIRNGGQATGVKAHCNGNLTAGGHEIVLGGDATEPPPPTGSGPTGRTFASLPATDLSASYPQLCRAT